MIKSTATMQALFSFPLVRVRVLGSGNSENLTAAQRKTNNENGAFLPPALIDFKTMPKIARISRDNFNHREIIGNKAIARYSTK